MSLTSYLTEGLLPEEKKKQTTAVYAGGFKPPTAGHFEVVEEALKQNPEIDEFIIFIGTKERNGISQDESLLIWEVYNNYLPFKVKLEPTSIPPVKAVYDFAKNHPTREVLWIIGAREGNDEDFKDISARTTSISKYPNLELRTIITQGGVSGTAVRNASKVSLEKFIPFLPTMLNPEEQEEVYNIVADKISENDPEDGKAAPYGSGYDKVEEYTIENSSDGKVKDQLQKYIDDYTEIDLDLLKKLLKDKKKYPQELDPRTGGNKFGYRGMTFKKEFIDKLKPIRTSNGVTEYEAPSNIKVKSRSDKGYLSFTTDEQVAKGFGHYSGYVDHKKSPDRVGGYVRVSLDNPNFIFHPNFTGELSKDLEYSKESEKETLLIGSSFTPDKIYVVDKKLKENATYSQHIDVMEKIAQLTRHMIDKGMNIEPLPTMEFVDGDSENAKDFFGKTAYYDPNKKHIVVYTEGRHPKDIVRSYAHEMIHHIQNLEGRLGNLTTTNTHEDDKLNDLEAEANLKGTMTFRNWTDSLNEEKNKDPFGLNAFARELAMGLEEQENISEPNIYLDMDGVVANFDKRFEDLSGMLPQAYVDKNGLNAFWDLIDEKHKVAFWRGIEVMPGAEKLVNFVSQYPYQMLTAPSVKKQSIIGKSLWVKDKVGTLYPSKPKVFYRKAKLKHTVKPELTKNDILIDDRADTIGRWDGAGGTAILFQSADQVINDLKQLGL